MRKLLNTTGIVQYWDEKKSLCMLCGELENANIFINPQGKSISFAICNSCIEHNKLNKYVTCCKCYSCFPIDFTELKNGDVIHGGLHAFDHCLKCLKTYTDACLPSMTGFDLICGTNDEDEYDEMTRVPLRILGKSYDEEERIMNDGFTDEEIHIIKHKINNLLYKDAQQFGFKGDVDVEYVNELLKAQNMKCYICKDDVLIKAE